MAKRQPKRIPGIYARGNNWRIDTSYKGIRLKETCATREMAETNLRKLKTLVDEDRYLDKKKDSRETLGRFAKRYLEWCEDIGQKDIRTKKQRVQFMVNWFGSDTLLSQITFAEVERYQAERLSSLGPRNIPLKPATVNRELAALKHLFTKALEWKVIEESPTRGVKLKKEKNRRLRYLTSEECQLLLDSCPTRTIKYVITLAINTGMRKSEILNLIWDHVNLREGYLEILDQKNDEYDTVPLNKAVLDVLRAIPRRLGNDYVFPGRVPGKPFCDLKGQFEKAIETSGLQDVTFHTLRHTAASHLVMSGADLTTVKEILRHKSIEMTLRYAHLSPAHKKSAVDGLEKSLQGGREKSLKRA